MVTKATEKQIENITKNGRKWSKHGQNRVYPKNVQALWVEKNTAENLRYSANRINDALFLDINSGCITHEDHTEHLDILEMLGK